jgi:hypothetical protein
MEEEEYISYEHHVIMGHDAVDFANYTKKRFPINLLPAPPGKKLEQ